LDDATIPVLSLRAEPTFDIETHIAEVKNPVLPHGALKLKI
jgi:hypothetical protein